MKYDFIVFSPFSPFRTGGLEASLRYLLQNFEKKGYKSLTVSSNYGKEKNRIGRNQYINHLNVFTLLNGQYPVFLLHYILISFRNLIRNSDAVVIVYDRHFTSSVISYVMCRLLNRKYVLVNQTTNSLYFENFFVQKIANFLERYVFARVVKNAVINVCVSKGNEKYIKQNFNVSNTQVIYNTIDFSEVVEGKMQREKIVLFASNTRKVKNADLSYKAFSDLSKKYTDWKFIMIGKGVGKYKNDSNPNNLILEENSLSKSKLYELFQKTSIYVNSSFQEGLSVAVIEAIAHGCVPVLSNNDSNKEIAKIIDRENYLFENNNIESYKSVLSHVISNLSLGEFKNSRLQIKKFYKNINPMQEYINLLKDIQETQSLKSTHEQAIF